MYIYMYLRRIKPVSKGGQVCSKRYSGGRYSYITYIRCGVQYLPSGFEAFSIEDAFISCCCVGGAAGTEREEWWIIDSAPIGLL